jgi:hypothetical protein
MAIDLVLETTKQKNDKTLASSPFMVFQGHKKLLGVLYLLYDTKQTPTT